MNNEKADKNVSVAPAPLLAEVGTAAYQGSVASRALARAGHCPNVKGIAFEIMFRDKLAAQNLFTGNSACLTKSATAVRDDVLLKHGGRVVSRFQLKDTPSAGGVRDTVNRIKAGQYSRTNIIGTSETASAVNEKLVSAKTKIKVKDSGISSKTTQTVALQINGGNPLKNLDLIAAHSKKTGLAGAACGAVISAGINTARVCKRKLDLDEAVFNVACDTGKSAAAAAVAGGVDVGVTMALAATPLMPVAKLIGAGAGIAAGCGVDLAFGAVSKAVDNRIRKNLQRELLLSDGKYGEIKRGLYYGY